NQGKGDLWAPCPFHQEKTASFHVDDRKGFYYCFGCHAKGDLFSFVRETENVGFMEAVEILAREAGMQMPARDPKAQEKADRRTQLTEVMEQAVAFFKLQLKTGAGAAARDYLAGRQLEQRALDRWDIGFAPPGWQNLWDHLTGKGVAEELILAAGLAKASTQGKKPYDTFRDRIMFPIRDARGRAIAFGGRAMDPNDNAKYLNSPETELFNKGRSLYNLGPAREAAGAKPLIVAEGYMDVIALVEAGFEAAVAPLGTALTEAHLDLLWRISGEPHMALDGDAAGLRAAYSAADLALPKAGPGRSLRFILLPEGQDPDDMLRSEGGAPTMRQMIEGAEPLVEMLWRRATAGRALDTPEQRAAFERDLGELSGKIADPVTRRHYEEALKDRKFKLFRELRQPAQNRSNFAAGGKGRGRNASDWRALAGPTDGARRRASSSEDATFRVFESFLALALLNHPLLLEKRHADVDALGLFCDDLDTVLNALLFASPAASVDDIDAARRFLEESVDEHCGAGTVARLSEALDSIMRRDIAPGADFERVESAFDSMLRRRDAALAELETSRELEEESLSEPDDSLFARRREQLRRKTKALGSQEAFGGDKAQPGKSLEETLEVSHRLTKRAGKPS
ncbi:MAG: DNA primase, partial [Pseudomonadota bacterium]